MGFAPGMSATSRMRWAIYVENLGATDLRFLEVFRSDHCAGISAAEWMVRSPPELGAAHLHPGGEIPDAVPARKPGVS